MTNLFKGNLIKLLSAAVLGLLCISCASITKGTSQTVQVQVKSASGENLKGVKCQLSNDKGTWYTKSNTPVMITKSSKDLKVICTKSGYEEGSAIVSSSISGTIAGNILIGGGIGAVIDHSNGSAYDYPNSIPVTMGTSKYLGKLDHQLESGKKD